MFAEDGTGPLMIDLDIGDERYALPYSSITDARLVGVRELYLRTLSRTFVVQGDNLIPVLVGLCNHRLVRLFVTRGDATSKGSMRIDRIFTVAREAE
jgi:hypothetical protein